MKFQNIVFTITLSILPFWDGVVVEGLVNNTCPLASSSPDGSKQQIITPFQWNDNEWYEELGTIVQLLEDFVPGGVSAMTFRN